MSNQYHVACDCGAVNATLSGEPRVRGFCHCEDCRELLTVPYHSVNAWQKEQVTVIEGVEALREFQHPTKRMKRSPPRPSSSRRSKRTRPTKACRA